MRHVGDTREMPTGFWRRNLKERDYSEDLGVEGKITLKFIRKEKESEYTINLTKDSDKGRTSVVTIMNCINCGELVA
jgi:hypothetical protein